MAKAAAVEAGAFGGSLRAGRQTAGVCPELHRLIAMVTNMLADGAAVDFRSPAGNLCRGDGLCGPAFYG
jgi:hypothetical protein